jgi:hypothetical protein
MTSPTTPLLLDDPSLEPARLTSGMIYAAPGSRATTRLRYHPLPALLAGPIIRYSSREELRIWLATSARLSARLDVYLLARDDDDEDELVGSSGEGVEANNDIIEVGKYLFINVVTTASLRMREGRVYGYDLVFTAPDSLSFDHGHGLIAPDELVYPPYRLPTFYRGFSATGAAKLLHGSCRKLHAPGDDAMIDADAHVASQASLLRPSSEQLGRPTFMLLTGDQIYADDVYPDRLGPTVSELGELLLGYYERMPDTSETPEVARGRFPSLLDGAERERALLGEPRDDGSLLNPATGFSYDRDLSHTSDPHNNAATRSVSAGRPSHHLMSLGEFMAMYLLMWSPSLSRHGRYRDDLGHAYDVRLPAVVAARRLLANVPTYMMIDDHEVTDDLAITQAQWEAMATSRLGRWVVANGRTAVWLCQLYGVGPASAGNVIEPNLTNYRDAARAAFPADGEAATSAPDAYNRARDDYSWNIIAYHGGFSYRTPTFPPVYMMDTRTQRELGTESPALLSSDALAGLASYARSVRRNRWTSACPLLVVSPAPVLGITVIEEFFQRQVPINLARDPEAWSLNGSCYSEMLDTLMAGGHTNAVIFSGDVHYGFVIGGDWTKTDLDGESSSVHIIQLTSSALCNHPEEGLLDAIYQVDTTLSEDIDCFFNATTGERMPRPEAGIPVGSEWRLLRARFEAVTGDHRHVYPQNNYGKVFIQWRGGVTVTQRLSGPAGDGRAAVIQGIDQPEPPASDG